MFLRRFLFLGCLLCLTLTSQAALIDFSNHLEQRFDSKIANKVLNKYNTRAAVEKAGLSELRGDLLQLTKFEALAKKCVDEDNNLLDTLNKQLSQISTSSKTSASVAELKFLSTKKDQLANDLSSCRLYILKSDEVITTLTERLRLLVKTEFLYSEPNIFYNVGNFPSNFQQFYSNFNTGLFLEQSGFYLFNNTTCVIVGALILFGLAIGIYLRKLLRGLMKNSPTTLGQQLVQAFTLAVCKYLIYLVPVFIFALAITVLVILFSLDNLPFLATLSYGVLGYLLFLILVRFFFYPPKPAQGFSQLPETIARKLTNRLKFLADICLIAFALHVLFGDQNIPDSLLDLSRTFFITLFSICLIAVIWLVKSMPKLLYHYRGVRFLLNFGLSSLLIIILIGEWLGFHLLASYLLNGLAVTVLAVYVARTLQRLVTLLLNDPQTPGPNWQQKFKRLLGLKYYETLPELLWLRAVLYLIIWTLFLLVFLKTWGVAQTSFQIMLSALLQGFKITTILIVPARIIFAALLFISLTLCTRLLRHHIAKRAELSIGQGNREALAAILGYIGFAIALLIGLLIAGVNFSGLAIVAGALSVGIGFGLQNIVNNFVSGIILLVERPIKPGDRIIVGETEGYVRRISIRSTHIITLQRSDVIVPNSELIAKQVTNYMLYDTNYKISVAVGVTYGSNTALTKKLLLEIAYAHPLVITNIKGHEPTVYFKTFGDSSLNFELWCLVTDVNSKADVQSDLHFAINNEFRKHNIDIAFPQREINIRNWPLTPEKIN